MAVQDINRALGNGEHEIALTLQYTQPRLGTSNPRGTGHP
jgi:hypothetical protein